MNNSVNGMNANPAFGGCALMGPKAQEYLSARLAAEGKDAVKGFQKFCDNLCDWGYVKLEKTPKEDVFRLQGANDLYSTNITKKTRLDELAAKMSFMKENKAIIDQA